MKTVIEMAREAGMHYSGACTLTGMESHVERFAALVRAEAIAEEREACAKLCEEQMTKWPFGVREKVCAAAIRVRGQA